MEIFVSKMANRNMGQELGNRLSEAIRHNISLQDRDIVARKLENATVIRFTERYLETVGPSAIKMMQELSKGSGISFERISRYNALQDILSPEGCTTFAAIGKATSSGKPVLLKNRDQNRELVNVVIATETNDGNVMVGVTNAGSTGFMMGLNKYGVAVASNAGITTEISHIPSRELRGISGRPQILREGLECKSAYDAVNLALQKLTASPMGMPGMMFFVDAKDIYVVEGGWTSNQFAVQHITDGAISRSNHFEMLKQLNDQSNVSVVCRRIRANELIKQNFGEIDCKKLKEFSVDHKNGPNDNSICRHSKDPEEGVTVSASIMEINGADPQKSIINIALGSPCWAWAHEEGNMTFQMDQDIAIIPQRFLNGVAFQEYLKDECYT